MSAIASFYLIRTKDKFEEFCRMANLGLKEELYPNGYYVIPSATPPEGSDVDYEARRRIWKYLRECTEEPFKYDWSGWNLSEMLDCLKQVKNIDLMKFEYVETGGSFPWWLFNLELKQQYFQALSPANHSESSLQELPRLKEELELEKLSKELSNKEITKKRFAERKRQVQEFRSYFEFPDSGKAFKDGMNTIYEYMKLVDENSVVFLHVG